MRKAIVILFCIYSQNYVSCIKEYKGIDICYNCKHDNECREGNGGEYSKCNRDLNICICTINHLGEDNCIFDGDRENGVCRRETSYIELGFCSLECSPNGTIKWREDHDWFGEIVQPFASFIPDKKTSVCYDPRRAFNSVPDGIEIKQSTIPNAGLGTFANIYIEQYTVFSPYKGTFGTDSLYSWTIYPRKGEDRADDDFVDATDIALSNWVRFVNTPTTAAMENIYALQYKGEVFYQAFRSIQPGTELFVWYGDNYADYLELEEFEHPRYFSSFHGYVGSYCDEEGHPCLHDKNTLCADEMCICIAGTHNRAGICISDETLGGLCVGLDGETCKHDKSAECQGGICICKNNSSPANGVCIPDETFGGRCAGSNGETCLFDNNTECEHGLCRCKYGNSGIGGKCVADETYQGRCIGINGETCELDENAEYFDRICICKKNASAINGKCEIGIHCQKEGC